MIAHYATILLRFISGRSERAGRHSGVMRGLVPRIHAFAYQEDVDGRDQECIVIPGRASVGREGKGNQADASRKNGSPSRAARSRARRAGDDSEF